MKLRVSGATGEFCDTGESCDTGKSSVTGEAGNSGERDKPLEPHLLA